MRLKLDYITSEYQENVDWESCHRKYLDITSAFRRQGPLGDTALGKDFRHNPRSISHGQLATKLKTVRNKYRRAVDLGRQSCQGRGVLFFFNFVRKYEVDRRSPLLVVVCAAAAFFRSHDGDGAMMSSFLQRCCFHCPHGNDVNMLNGVFHIFQKIPFLGPKTALPCGRAKTVKNFTVFMHKRCSVDWALECGRWSTW